MEGETKWFSPKKAHFFDDLSYEEKQKFTSILEVQPIGKPVILFRGKNKHWTVLGTKMIVSGTDSAFNSVEYSKITDSTIGDDPFGKFSSKAPSKFSFFLFRLRKFKQDKILVMEEGGRMITLHGPKGERTDAMYNLLLMLERMWKG